MFEFFYNFCGLNQQIFLVINHLTNNSILPYILQTISFCFNISNFAIIYILCCIVFYVQLRKIPQALFSAIYDKMIQVGIIYTLFGLSFALLKFSFNLPRPFCSMPIGSFITIANIELERCLSSFPSSHTGLAILTSYFVWPYISHIGKFFTSLGVILVAVSRLCLAMHYPADIFYSILITGIIIVIGNVIFRVLKEQRIYSILKDRLLR